MLLTEPEELCMAASILTVRFHKYSHNSQSYLLNPYNKLWLAE